MVIYREEKASTLLWYALAPKAKEIIGYVPGWRIDESLERLPEKLSECRITRFDS
jgi:IS1 family transposase